MLASLFIWPPAFLGVIVLAAGVGIWEMVRAVRATGAHPPLVPLLAGGVLMIGLAWYAGADALSSACWSPCWPRWSGGSATAGRHSGGT